MQLRSSMMIPSVLRQTARSCTRLCRCSQVSASSLCDSARESYCRRGQLRFKRRQKVAVRGNSTVRDAALYYKMVHALQTFRTQALSRQLGLWAYGDVGPDLDAVLPKFVALGFQLAGGQGLEHAWVAVGHAQQQGRLHRASHNQRIHAQLAQPYQNSRYSLPLLRPWRCFVGHAAVRVKHFDH